MRKNLLCLIALLLCSAGTVSSQVNVKVNTTARGYEPEEPSLFINPVDPLNIIAGANINNYYWTRDGGKTWTEGQLPGNNVWGDPVLYFDSYGKAFFLHLGKFNNTGIYISTSTDGGESWSLSKCIFGFPGSKPFQDKEWITSDKTNSSFKDNMYVSWTEFDEYDSHHPRDSSRIRFSRSTDFGETFSEAVKISDIGGNSADNDSTVEGAVPCVGSEGEVYVAWSGPRGIEFDRSFDGGLTFGEDVRVIDQVGGWTYDIPGIYRCNGLPFTASDISESSYRGTVYINYSDERNGDHDVFVLRSTDKGTTWSSPVRVNDDPVGNGKEQFMSHFCVDPVTGSIYVLFYDRRNYDDSRTDVYLGISKDGGATFVNKKVSSEPFYPDKEIFFGDYIGVNSYNDIYGAVWMRMDRKVLSLQFYTNRWE